MLVQGQIKWKIFEGRNIKNFDRNFNKCSPNLKGFRLNLKDWRRNLKDFGAKYKDFGSCLKDLYRKFWFLRGDFHPDPRSSEGTLKIPEGTASCPRGFSKSQKGRRGSGWKYTTKKQDFVHIYSHFFLIHRYGGRCLWHKYFQMLFAYIFSSLLVLSRR